MPRSAVPVASVGMRIVDPMVWCVMKYSRARAAVPSPAAATIRAARAAAGLTQSQAAARVDCSLRAWQSWEGGERRIHPAVWRLFLSLSHLKEV